jgi:agmatinase
MATFMNLPRFEEAKVVILPVPYEKTTSYKKGTKKASEYILKASKELELYDEELEKEPYNVGITTLDEIKSLEDLEKLETDKFLIAIGGEHTITLPLVKRFPEEKLSILHIDAHADLKNKFEDTTLNHATVMRRISEFNKNITQVGIRSLSEEEHSFIKANNINTFFMKDLVYNRNYVGDIIRTLKEDVYITIDVDALDPSIIPDVSNPEPGGLRWYQLLNLLKQVFKQRNVVGVDIVEFCPRKETNSDYILAKLIYKIIGYKYMIS